MSRYIDADKLQEVFKELHGGKRSLLIDTEPTADVRENVRGKWIKGGMSSLYKCQCSECGCYHRAMYDFCPSCGAEMIGGGKE